MWCSELTKHSNVKNTFLFDVTVTSQEAICFVTRQKFDPPPSIVVLISRCRDKDVALFYKRSNFIVITYFVSVKVIDFLFMDTRNIDIHSRIVYSVKRWYWYQIHEKSQECLEWLLALILYLTKRFFMKSKYNILSRYAEISLPQIERHGP